MRELCNCNKEAIFEVHHFIRPRPSGEKIWEEYDVIGTIVVVDGQLMSKDDGKAYYEQCSGIKPIKVTIIDMRELNMVGLM